ncbi:MAG: hypothetical protein ACLGIG_04865 [Actinomycetes bacterium]
MTLARPVAISGSVLSALLLAGCAEDPRGEIRALVEDVTVEANERDADGVRTAVDELVVTVDSAVAAGDLPESEAAVIRSAALAVQEGADEIDPDVIARREAEAEAEEARQQLEAERRAAEEDRQRAEREAEEQAEKEAEEERKRLEEERGKGEEPERKDDDEEGDG